MADIQPGFVTYEENAREAFLSQVGNFSPLERSIFHKMCRVWEPSISYNRFISLINHDIPNAQAELSRLIAKLEKANMGIISTAIRDGQRNPESIIICDPGHHLFYRTLLAEEVLNCMEDLHMPFPTIAGLVKKNLVIPGDLVSDATFHDAAQMYVDKKKTTGRIISLPLDGGDKLILNSDNVTRVLTIFISKIRTYFQSANLLALVAASLEMSLTELRTNVSGKDPGFWKMLGENFLQNQANFEAQRKVKLPGDMFIVAQFLKHFLTAQIQVAKERKAAEENRQADMKSLLEIIKTAENFMMPLQLFENHLEDFRKKYDDDFKDFYEEFTKTFLTAANGKNLPYILQIDQTLVHQDNVKSLFLQRVDVVSRELYRHYVPLMSRWVRHNQAQLTDVFNSVTTFESDIEDKVKELDHMLATFLSRPSTIAEAFILAGRRAGAMDDVESMKSQLVGFFYPETIQFKELQVIFNLDVNEIYKHAFLNFGIIRQLILRLTGRHESFQKKFSGQTQSLYRKMANELALPERYQHKLSDAQDKSSASKRQRRRLSGRTVQGRPVSSKSNESNTKKTETSEAAKRLYSIQERDDAWQEFSKSLKK